MGIVVMHKNIDNREVVARMARVRYEHYGLPKADIAIEHGKIVLAEKADLETWNYCLGEVFRSLGG